MCDRKWYELASSKEGPGYLEDAIRRYYQFLELLSIPNVGHLTPADDIDLAWHTHQLSGSRYRYGFLMTPITWMLKWLPEAMKQSTCWDPCSTTMIHQISSFKVKSTTQSIYEPAMYDSIFYRDSTNHRRISVGGKSNILPFFSFTYYGLRNVMDLHSGVQPMDQAPTAPQVQTPTVPTVPEDRVRGAGHRLLSILIETI